MKRYLFIGIAISALIPFVASAYTAELGFTASVDGKNYTVSGGVGGGGIISSGTTGGGGGGGGGGGSISPTPTPAPAPTPTPAATPVPASVPNLTSVFTRDLASGDEGND